MTQIAYQGRQTATDVGNAITRLYREHYGRGATTTRTVWQRNYITVFLDDIYTPIERTLIDAGHQDTVKSTREKFQMTMREKFSAAVEEITGRTIVQLMSQVSFDPDMAVEVFVLEPLASDEPPSANGTDPAA